VTAVDLLEIPSLEPQRIAVKSGGGLRYDRLTLAMFALGVVENAMIVLRIDIRWLLPTLGLLLALALPTRLLAKVFKSTIHGPGIRIPLALSLTILALMAGGLILNTILPWFGDSHPLARVPILCFIDAFNVAIVLVRPQCVRVEHIQRARLRTVEKWLIGVTILGVLLAVLGAVRLNNNAGGGLAEVALSVVCILAIVLMVSAGKIRPGVLVFCLYGLALAVLYMTSLRGWYTTGHDIQGEFRVFSIVNSSERWSVSRAGTSYAACLSITILPQMLWELTRVATPYVYKTDFPLMFAACPLALYELSRRVLGQRLAIACALLFISFPTFVNDMVFLNRQEIAFLYISVIVALISCGGSNLRMRRILIGICVVGMVMSHYSTSYVFLATMLIAVIGLSVSKLAAAAIGAFHGPAHARERKVTRLGKTTRSRLSKRPVVFNWTLLIFCSLLVVAWTFVDIQATPSFNQNLHQAFGAFVGSDSSSANNSDVNYSVVPSGNDSSAGSQLAQYRAQLEQQIGPHPVKQGYYPTSLVNRYPTPPGPVLRSGPTPIGKALNKIGINPNALNATLRNLIARLLQLLAILGVVLVFLGWRRSLRVTSAQVYIAIGSIVLLVASVVLPTLSVNYGILRMFQQALFILAPFIIIGALFLLRPLGVKRAEIGACVVTGIFFFSLTGLLPQITGSYSPQLNLNNSGEYYENYYTEPQEISAIQWLNTVASKDSTIQADPFAAPRFQAYTSFEIDPNDFPSLVYRDSYVVLNTYTVQTGISTAGPNGNLIDFRYPVAFLKSTKNLIYASNGAEIFGP
jgi:uncharacterized membrane protein